MKLSFVAKCDNSEEGYVFVMSGPLVAALQGSSYLLSDESCHRQRNGLRLALDLLVQSLASLLSDHSNEVPA